jgi:hypothetical protein
MVQSRGECPQGNGKILKFQDRPSRRHSANPARQICHEPFGRSGDHNVLALRIEEDVLEALQACQAAHRFVGLLSLIELPADCGFQPNERDLAQPARVSVHGAA